MSLNAVSTFGCQKQMTSKVFSAEKCSFLLQLKWNWFFTLDQDGHQDPTGIFLWRLSRALFGLPAGSFYYIYEMVLIHNFMCEVACTKSLYFRRNRWKTLGNERGECGYYHFIKKMRNISIVFSLLVGNHLYTNLKLFSTWMMVITVAISATFTFFTGWYRHFYKTTFSKDSGQAPSRYVELHSHVKLTTHFPFKIACKYLMVRIQAPSGVHPAIKCVMSGWNSFTTRPFSNLAQESSLVRCDFFKPGE